VNNKQRGYVKGVPFTKRHVVEFNPSSRIMIADRLKAKGWVPLEFTPGGQPKIDETILSKLEWPEAKVLADHFLVEKRIGQLAEGDQAWLRLDTDGSIHASVNTLGAVTGRCTHSNPNIAQVPKVGSAYGEECRSLFVARKGYKLVGVDLAGVELRCLSHYMARYDGGAYGIAVVEGSSKDETDVHSLNAKALGLNPHTIYNVFGKQKTGRDIAKTFIYAFLYGAGDEKLGSIIGVSEEEIERFPETKAGLWRKAFNVSLRDGREPDPVVVAMIVKGGMLKTRFLKQTPALSKLKEAVTEKAKKPRSLIGLDGRVLFVRSAHSALNTLLQSAGAVLAKEATVISWDDLSARGWEWETDWALVAHIHDELQNEAREDIADEVGQTIRQAMRKAGEKYAMRVPIDGNTRSAATGPKLTSVLKRAWTKPFSTKSDFARAHADHVALAASDGLITTRIAAGCTGVNGWSRLRASSAFGHCSRSEAWPSPSPTSPTATSSMRWRKRSSRTLRPTSRPASCRSSNRRSTRRANALPGLSNRSSTLMSTSTA
jgi:DNA polymerase-1